MKEEGREGAVQGQAIQVTEEMCWNSETTLDWKSETKKISTGRYQVLASQGGKSYCGEDVTIETGQEKEWCSPKIPWVSSATNSRSSLLITDSARPQSHPGVTVFKASLEVSRGPFMVTHWCMRHPIQQNLRS